MSAEDQLARPKPEQPVTCPSCGVARKRLKTGGIASSSLGLLIGVTQFLTSRPAPGVGMYFAEREWDLTLKFAGALILLGIALLFAGKKYKCPNCQKNV